jgi:hypothetical protein
MALVIFVIFLRLLLKALGEVHLAGFLAKLIICPIVVVVSSLVFSERIHYNSIFQPVIAGLVLAVLAHVIEALFLKQGRVLIIAVTDLISSSLAIYLLSSAFSGSSVTFSGAVLTGILLALTEYFEHVLLVMGGRAQKS